MDRITATLTKTKETKGTHVFANEEAGLSIYVPKNLIKGGVPRSIVLTLSEPSGVSTPDSAEPEM
jgi:hypothetical protein